MQVLVEYKADLTLRDERMGSTVLMSAVSEKNMLACEYVLKPVESGGCGMLQLLQVGCSSGLLPYHRALMLGDYKVCVTLGNIFCVRKLYVQWKCCCLVMTK